MSQESAAEHSPLWRNESTPEQLTLFMRAVEETNTSPVSLPVTTSRILRMPSFDDDEDDEEEDDTLRSNTRRVFSGFGPPPENPLRAMFMTRFPAAADNAAAYPTAPNDGQAPTSSVPSPPPEPSLPPVLPPSSAPSPPSVPSSVTVPPPPRTISLAGCSTSHPATNPQDSAQQSNMSRARISRRQRLSAQTTMQPATASDGALFSGVEPFNPAWNPPQPPTSRVRQHNRSQQYAGSSSTWQHAEYLPSVPQSTIDDDSSAAAVRNLRQVRFAAAPSLENGARQSSQRVRFPVDGSFADDRETSQQTTSVHRAATESAQEVRFTVNGCFSSLRQTSQQVTGSSADSVRQSAQQVRVAADGNLSGTRQTSQQAVDPSDAVRQSIQVRFQVDDGLSNSRQTSQSIVGSSGESVRQSTQNIRFPVDDSLAEASRRMSRVRFATNGAPEIVRRTPHICYPANGNTSDSVRYSQQVRFPVDGDLAGSAGHMPQRVRFSTSAPTPPTERTTLPPPRDPEYVPSNARTRRALRARRLRPAVTLTQPDDVVIAPNNPFDGPAFHLSEPVCASDGVGLGNGDPVMLLPCGHVVHVICAQRINIQHDVSVNPCCPRDGQSFFPSTLERFVYRNGTLHGQTMMQPKSALEIAVRHLSASNRGNGFDSLESRRRSMRHQVNERSYSTDSLSGLSDLSNSRLANGERVTPQSRSVRRDSQSDNAFSFSASTQSVESSLRSAQESSSAGAVSDGSASAAAEETDNAQDMDTLRRLSEQVIYSQREMSKREHALCAHVGHALRRAELSTKDELAKRVRDQLQAALERHTKESENFSKQLDEAIKKLERMTSSVQTDSYEAPECVIDLAPIKNGDEVVRLPCMHVFHTECLMPYLNREDTPMCPIDRVPVPKRNVHRLPVWKWGEK